MKIKPNTRAGIAPIWIAIVLGVWVVEGLVFLWDHNREADPAFRKTEVPAIPSNK